MDSISHGYYAWMKVWGDSAPPILVRWFRAAHEAKAFPGLNAFNSSRWNQERGPRRLGEVPRIVPLPHRPKRNAIWKPANWIAELQYDKGLNPLGYAGQGFAGPLEAFAEGGRWGVDPPLALVAGGAAAACGPIVPTRPGPACACVSMSGELDLVNPGLQAEDGSPLRDESGDVISVG